MKKVTARRADDAASLTDGRGGGVLRRVVAILGHVVSLQLDVRVAPGLLVVRLVLGLVLVRGHGDDEHALPATAPEHRPQAAQAGPHHEHALAAVRVLVGPGADRPPARHRLARPRRRPTLPARTTGPGRPLGPGAPHEHHTAVVLGPGASRTRSHGPGPPDHTETRPHHKDAVAVAADVAEASLCVLLRARTGGPAGPETRPHDEHALSLIASQSRETRVEASAGAEHARGPQQEVQNAAVATRLLLATLCVAVVMLRGVASVAAFASRRLDSRGNLGVVLVVLNFTVFLAILLAASSCVSWSFVACRLGDGVVSVVRILGLLSLLARFTYGFASRRLRDGLLAVDVLADLGAASLFVLRNLVVSGLLVLGAGSDGPALRPRAAELRDAGQDVVDVGVGEAGAAVAAARLHVAAQRGEQREVQRHAPRPSVPGQAVRGRQHGAVAAPEQDHPQARGQSAGLRVLGGGRRRRRRAEVVRTDSVRTRADQDGNAAAIDAAAASILRGHGQQSGQQRQDLRAPKGERVRVVWELFMYLNTLAWKLSPARPGPARALRGPRHLRHLCADQPDPAWSSQSRLEPGGMAAAAAWSWRPRRPVCLLCAAALASASAKPYGIKGNPGADQYLDQRTEDGLGPLPANLPSRASPGPGPARAGSYGPRGGGSYGPAGGSYGPPGGSYGPAGRDVDGDYPAPSSGYRRPQTGGYGPAEGEYPVAGGRRPQPGGSYGPRSDANIDGGEYYPAPGSRRPAPGGSYGPGPAGREVDGEYPLPSSGYRRPQPQSGSYGPAEDEYPAPGPGSRPRRPQGGSYAAGRDVDGDGYYPVAPGSGSRAPQGGSYAPRGSGAYGPQTGNLHDTGLGPEHGAEHGGLKGGRPPMAGSYGPQAGGSYGPQAGSLHAGPEDVEYGGLKGGRPQAGSYGPQAGDLHSGPEAGYGDQGGLKGGLKGGRPQAGSYGPQTGDLHSGPEAGYGDQGGLKGGLKGGRPQAGSYGPQTGDLHSGPEAGYGDQGGLKGGLKGGRPQAGSYGPQTGDLHSEPEAGYGDQGGLKGGLKGGRPQPGSYGPQTGDLHSGPEAGYGDQGGLKGGLKGGRPQAGSYGPQNGDLHSGPDAEHGGLKGGSYGPQTGDLHSGPETEQGGLKGGRPQSGSYGPQAGKLHSGPEADHVAEQGGLKGGSTPTGEGEIEHLMGGPAKGASGSYGPGPASANLETLEPAPLPLAGGGSYSRSSQRPGGY
ncbi:Translation initiation factor IF-2 [Frankliniella fusca]|uniref:Translation initiation factor IF-2 n=1 Tax=Frankliniella fusca TaxID=407009 RepID=A0AAE1LPV4_9NEOP|nr:Translation initiation factor IF-2 [Frankliniella fusca]